MIIGRDFAWGHMGKTAGDATLTLFKVVDDLIGFNHESDDRHKHVTFKSYGPEALEKPIKVLNIRRLPSWQLSLSQHRARHGTAADPTPIPIPAPERMASSTEADEMLNSFTADGTIEITHWLRVETLREDFIRFAQLFRPLSIDEIQTISHVKTKRPMPYDHDYFTHFSLDQLKQLYESNPAWAEVELAVYGSLVAEAAH